jgi:hypothetical protein
LYQWYGKAFFSVPASEQQVYLLHPRPWLFGEDYDSSQVCMFNYGVGAFAGSGITRGQGARQVSTKSGELYLP